MARKKFFAVNFILEGISSFPILGKPRPFKGKEYRSIDVILDPEEDAEQISKLQSKIKLVRVKNWGEDKTEWPKKAKGRFIQDGNDRQDMPVYKDKMFVVTKTTQEIEVLSPSGKPVDPDKIKGGMRVKVAVRISGWDNEGEEGLSIWLQHVLVDPNQERLPGFGGKSSAKSVFKDHLDSDYDDESEDESEDEDDVPRGKKKKPSKSDEDEDDVPPKKKKKPSFSFDDEDEDESEDESEEE